MVNRKAIGASIVVIFIILIVITYATNSMGVDAPSIPSQDSSTEVSDYTVVEKNIVSTDTNNPNFVIDENGNKRYVISAVDSPVLSD